MDIFLPVAGAQINLLLIIAWASGAGFLSGMFGVGGGFLLTPALIMIGIPGAVAAASDSNQIVAASLSSLLTHRRFGNVDWKLGLVIVSGGLVGGMAGTVLVHYLLAHDVFEFFLRLAYAVMLLFVGIFMLIEAVMAIAGKKNGKEACKFRLLSRLPGKAYFPVSGVEFPVYVLIALGFMVGLLSALMGVGGGFMMLPVLIYLVGVPTLVAIGTNLVTVLFTSILVALGQSMINHTVDILLAIVIVVSSSCSARVGASVCHCLKGEKLRIVFSFVALGVVILLMRDMLMPPVQLISVVGN